MTVLEAGRFEPRENISQIRQVILRSVRLLINLLYITAFYGYILLHKLYSSIKSKVDCSIYTLIALHRSTSISGGRGGGLMSCVGCFLAKMHVKTKELGLFGGGGGGLAAPGGCPGSATEYNC